MAKRRFEYTDEKSNKFWEIDVEGSSNTVRYGRIGSDGQTKTKSFDSDEKAEKEAEKLIGQKTKKGYVEVELGESDGPGAKVRELLVGLCKSNADHAILDKLVAATVSIDDDTIVFQEGDDYEWEVEYEPATDVGSDPDTPESFRMIAKVVSALAWDAGGPEAGYAVGEDGSPLADGWLFDELKYDREEEYNKVVEAGGAVASFMAGQNGLFFDPLKKLKNGEPGLAFVSHEGGGWVSVASTQNLDYGQILLRLLSDAMVGTNHIPEIYF